MALEQEFDCNLDARNGKEDKMQGLRHGGRVVQEWNVLLMGELALRILGNWIKYWKRILEFKLHSRGILLPVCALGAVDSTHYPFCTILDQITVVYTLLHRFLQILLSKAVLIYIYFPLLLQQLFPHFGYSFFFFFFNFLFLYFSCVPHPEPSIQKYKHNLSV